MRSPVTRRREIWSVTRSFGMSSQRKKRTPESLGMVAGVAVAWGWILARSPGILSPAHGAHDLVEQPVHRVEVRAVALGASGSDVATTTSARSGTTKTNCPPYPHAKWTRCVPASPTRRAPTSRSRRRAR
jgi:hypothetical protein